MIDKKNFHEYLKAAIAEKSLPKISPKSEIPMFVCIVYFMFDRILSQIKIT